MVATAPELAFFRRTFPTTWPTHGLRVLRSSMLHEDHRCQYKNDNEYDEPMFKWWGPRRFYDRYFRSRYGQTKSDPEFADDYS